MRFEVLAALAVHTTVLGYSTVQSIQKFQTYISCEPQRLLAYEAGENKATGRQSKPQQPCDFSIVQSHAKAALTPKKGWRVGGCQRLSRG